MAPTICCTYSHINEQFTLFYSCNHHEKNRCHSLSNVGKLHRWISAIFRDGLVICIICFCSVVDCLNYFIDFLDGIINLLKTKILAVLTTLVTHLKEKPTIKGGFL
jgi:hypothetical protein